MGVVYKRNSWWLDYRYNGRRYRQKVGASKTLADNAWAKIKVEIAENKFLDVRKVKQVRFEDFANQYLEMHCKINHKSYERASGSQIKMLKGFFSGKFLSEITPLDVEKFKKERMQKVSPATVNRGLTRLKAMFNMAIKWKDFEGPNPLKDVAFLKEENHKVRFLEFNEIEKLISVSKGNIKAIVVVAVNTGMRRGEILRLQWRDIDFNQGLIHLLETKSGKKRVIPMNDMVKNALIEVRKHPNSSYIFCKKDGQPLRDIRSIFEVVLKRANIMNFRFHDLRHTFASQLVMNGVDLNTVRELLGHSDLKTTLIYSHLSQDHKKRAVNVLSQKIGNILTKQEAPTIELTLPPLELALV